MAETLTKLNPIDAEKGYPQWGRVADEVSGQIEFTHDRQVDSVRYRETVGPFDQAATYEVRIQFPGFPTPFTNRVLGSQLAGPGAERQANYPFANIGQLPLFYLVTVT
jgi:hypothetical protein